MAGHTDVHAEQDRDRAQQASAIQGTRERPYTPNSHPAQASRRVPIDAPTPPQTRPSGNPA